MMIIIAKIMTMMIKMILKIKKEQTPCKGRPCWQSLFIYFTEYHDDDDDGDNNDSDDYDNDDQDDDED